jgi:hypothetical protein
VPKASQQPGDHEDIPCEGSDIDPTGDGACGQQSGRSVSRLASRHRAAILSDIIINESLKLLQINYLAQKVDGLFNFHSRPHCTCNRTYTKTRYIPEGGISIVTAVRRQDVALLHYCYVFLPLSTFLFCMIKLFLLYFLKIL